MLKNDEMKCFIEFSMPSNNVICWFLILILILIIILTIGLVWFGWTETMVQQRRQKMKEMKTKLETQQETVYVDDKKKE